MKISGTWCGLCLMTPQAQSNLFNPLCHLSFDVLSERFQRCDILSIWLDLCWLTTDRTEAQSLSWLNVWDAKVIASVPCSLFSPQHLNNLSPGTSHRPKLYEPWKAQHAKIEINKTYIKKSLKISILELISSGKSFQRSRISTKNPAAWNNEKRGIWRAQRRHKATEGQKYDSLDGSSQGFKSN